eukprot:g4491.t1
MGKRDKEGARNLFSERSSFYDGWTFPTVDSPCADPTCNGKLAFDYITEDCPIMRCTVCGDWGGKNIGKLNRIPSMFYD